MNPRKAKGYDKTCREGTFLLLGKAVTSKHYGFCRSHRIQFFRGNRTVYKWDREGETRREFFFGEQTPRRTYEGNQFCFIEYCAIVHKKLRFPGVEDLKDKLDESLAQIYREALERIVR